MTLGEVKKGMLLAMQKIFPKSKYKYYSMAVVENYERPCFFTQLKVSSSRAVNYNARQIEGTLYIDFFDETVDEARALIMVQMLQEVFGLSVPVGKRFVFIENIDYDFIGTEKTHLQLMIDLMWTAQIDHSQDLPIMESVKINRRMED